MYRSDETGPYNLPSKIVAKVTTVPTLARLVTTR